MAPKLTEIAPLAGQAKPNTVLQMAYGGKWGSATPHNTYRLERGFPFNRAGQVVAPVPQFRGLSLYASTSQPTGLKSFTSTTTKVTVKYPTAAK